MTETQLAALVRQKTGTNSTTLTNAVLQPWLNIFKDEICSLITQRNNTLWIIPSTDNLVADQREYAIPSDVLNHLISIEVAMTTDTPLKYVDAKPYNRRDFTLGLTESNIASSFSNSFPRYFRRRRAVYLLTGAIIAVTNGLRVTYRAYPADFAAALNGTTALEADPTTTTFGFPRQFHELLARRVGMEWKQSRPNPIPLDELEKNYNGDLEKQLDAVSREDFYEDTLGSLPDSNNGEDL